MERTGTSEPVWSFEMPAIYCHSCADNETATLNGNDLECDVCQSTFVEALGQAGIEQFKAPVADEGSGAGPQRRPDVVNRVINASIPVPEAPAIPGRMRGGQNPQLYRQGGMPVPPALAQMMMGAAGSGTVTMGPNGVMGFHVGT